VDLGAKDQHPLGRRLFHQLEIDLPVHPRPLERRDPLQRHDEKGQPCGHLLHRPPLVDLAGVQPQDARQRLGRVLRAKRRRKLLHPPIAVRAQAHGDAPRRQVERHPLRPAPQHLPPDHVRRAQGGVPGERYLLLGRKDAHIIAALARLLREDERRLREIDLPRQALHLLARDRSRIPKDGELVPRIFALGKDIDDVEPFHRWPSLVSHPQGVETPC